MLRDIDIDGDIGSEDGDGGDDAVHSAEPAEDERTAPNLEDDGNALTVTAAMTADDGKLNVPGTSDSAMSADTESSRRPFSKQFSMRMAEMDCILKDKAGADRALIGTVKEMKQCMESLIEAHLGKIDLIVEHCHHHKLKHALSHCHRILSLDGEHIVALCRKALCQWRLNRKKEALHSAQSALTIAKRLDEGNHLHSRHRYRYHHQRHGKAVKVKQEKFVCHQLEEILNDRDSVQTQSKLTPRTNTEHSD